MEDVEPIGERDAPPKQSLFEKYKSWVRRHPGMVQNLDWLLYLTVWNPQRMNSSEFGYEAYHAAVGLLSVWHQNIIDEVNLPVKRPAYSLWLDALEQVCRNPCMGQGTSA